MIDPLLIGFLTTTLLVLITWRLLPSVGRSARQKQMDNLLTGQPVEEIVVSGPLGPVARLVKKYAPASIIEDTRRELYWAHRQGKMLSFDPLSFTALRVVIAGGVGLYFLTVAGNPMNALLFTAGGWWLVGITLKSQAGGARREFRQVLPMAVATLDMLRASGASLDRAVQTMVQEAENIVSRWMAEVVSAAKGESPTAALLKASKNTGLPPLVRVCTTLHDIEERGVGLERLTAAAKEMVRDYRFELQKDASTLGTTSIFVIIAFDMIPFIALVAGPWVLTAFQVIS
jgi:Flp pilus assembly protein TadB